MQAMEITSTLYIWLKAVWTSYVYG